MFSAALFSFKRKTRTVYHPHSPLQKTIKSMMIQPQGKVSSPFSLKKISQINKKTSKNIFIEMHFLMEEKYIFIYIYTHETASAVNH